MPVPQAISQKLALRSSAPVDQLRSGGGACAGDAAAAAPSGSSPRSDGRSRTSRPTQSVTTTSTIRPSAPSAPRQPSCAISSAVSGGTTKPPAEVAIASTPIARPRCARNQRAVSVFDASAPQATVPSDTGPSTASPMISGDCANAIRVKPIANSTAPPIITLRAGRRSSRRPTIGAQTAKPTSRKMKPPLASARDRPNSSDSGVTNRPKE